MEMTSSPGVLERRVNGSEETDDSIDSLPDLISDERKGSIDSVMTDYSAFEARMARHMDGVFEWQMPSPVSSLLSSSSASTAVP